jgi:hypothetical protein
LRATRRLGQDRAEDLSLRPAILSPKGQEFLSGGDFPAPPSQAEAVVDRSTDTPGPMVEDSDTFLT